MKPAPSLPSWTASDEMVVWVNARLDESPPLSSEVAERLATFPDRLNKWLRDFELQAAQEGEIAPARGLIRKHFPLLADLVQLPPLKPGQKYRPIKFVFGRTDNAHRVQPASIEMRQLYRKSQIANAAKDVNRIRHIWQAHYGKKNRRRGDVSALEIAAERHGVTVDEVEQYLKTFLRTKSRIS